MRINAPPITHEELRKAYVEVVTSGKLRDQDVHRFWLLGTACTTCNLCVAIHEFAKAGIGVFDLYRFEDQTVLLPPVHDGCDCQEKYTADFSNVTKSPF